MCSQFTPRPRDIARFWQKVDKPTATDCWQWRACLWHGYGVFRLGTKNVQAHRFAYRLLLGPIPSHYDLHHRCKNKACVNPAHLEPLPRASHKDKHRPTHCKQGHLLDAANVYHVGSAHHCRTCTIERARTDRTARKEGRKPPCKQTRTHCRRGHLLDSTGVYNQPDGSRVCKACHRLSMEKYRAKAK